MSKINKKIFLILILFFISIMLLIGITYAVLSYRKDGSNKELIVGNIWMKYQESSKTINIENMMPSEEYQDNYFEFEVTGKNTYDKKDIYYEIVLNNDEYIGNDVNRTIPIDSQLLRFKLVEVIGNEEVEIFNNRTYSDIENKRIWVDTISSDDDNFSKIYRLYVRIYEYTNICLGKIVEDCDYYINPSEAYKGYDWDKLYASIKVTVKGDLEEKTIETDASCFDYSFKSVENPIVNPAMASQELVDNELSRCVNYLYTANYKLYEENSPESVCKGGPGFAGFTFPEIISMYLTEEEIQGLLDANVILDDSTFELNPIMKTQTTNELTTCNTYLSRTTFDEGSNAESFCKGVGTINNNTFQQILDSGNWVDYYNDFSKMKTIIPTEATIYLTSYNENCGPDVVIPKEINGYKIDNVSYYYSYGTDAIVKSMFSDKNVKNIVLLENIQEIGDYAFVSSGIKTIEIPNSVITIGGEAFSKNELKTVDLPDSLVEIKYDAFSYNKLMSIEIPSGITIISSGMFEYNNLTNVIIPENIIEIESYAFRDNKLTSIEISNSVTTIDSNVFYSNNLTNVVIPSSVIEIGSYAFSNNKLKTILIEGNVEVIDSAAFEKHATSNPDLETITFTQKTCEELKNIEINSFSSPLDYMNKKQFPWLKSTVNFYYEGYKADIIGSDGVCSY